MAALVDTRMPGVYTVEVPTIPPSIALVPTAVPVFIGYTAIHEKNGEQVKHKTVRVRNMREYVTWFGGPNLSTTEFEVSVAENNGAFSVSTILKTPLKHRMYYAMQLYYANGGGPCYILSIGNYDTEGNPYDATNGLEIIKALKKNKDITIIVMPDAVKDGNYNAAINLALQHCSTAVNRVTIIDVHEEDSENNDAITSNFRGSMPSQIDQKKYGAAYYPFLNTTLDYEYDDAKVTVKSYSKDGQQNTAAEIAATKVLVDDYVKAKKDLEKEKQNEYIYKSIKNIVEKNKTITIAELKKLAENEGKKLANLSFTLENSISTATSSTDMITAIDAFIATFKVSAKQAVYVAAEKSLKANAKNGKIEGVSIDIIEEFNNGLASQIREAIRNLPVVMPPSPAIAGLYVATDLTQGVWKAPANANLAAVSSTTVEIDDDLHAALNVDASTGKSINAIRPYTGRGILVYGARTLAGNDLEWRYISVRRTFCFIEDAIGRAMLDFVFAPNNRDTWIKVKAMISNFLNEIWKAGGLFGDTSKEAYQVNVGQPETMTDVDILEGKMIVEIKLRVTRPAEFIILRYEHKFNTTAN
jgi:phage tail sheath protein FI